MQSIQTILYPTDFSTCAEKAFNHALFLAEQFGAELHILHVSTLHGEEASGAFLMRPEELIKHTDEVAHSAMAKLLEGNREKMLKVVESRRRAMFAAPEILSYAEEHDVDCIVMGTHGRRGMRRALLGSVAEEVARVASCPVLTLREPSSKRKVKTFSCIIVPIDFSEHSKAALQTAIVLAKAYDAHLHLIHVINHLQLPSFYSPMVGSFEGEHYERVRRDAIGMMDKWMDELAGRDVPFSRHVRLGGTAEEIVSFAKEHESSLLVIATHGLTGLKHFFFGSTTDQVIRYINCPVWVVKSFGKLLFSKEED